MEKNIIIEMKDCFPEFLDKLKQGTDEFIKLDDWFFEDSKVQGTRAYKTLYGDSNRTRLPCKWRRKC